MSRRALGHTKVNVFIDPTVLSALRWLAKARGTSYSELIRTAAKQYVLQEISKEREDIIALASIAEAENGSR